MEKILIVNPFGIGDVLFTTPVIDTIKQKYPESRISYWCNERVRDILKNNPQIDKVFAFSRGDLKKLYRRAPMEGIKRFLGLIIALRKEGFQAAFDFSLDHRYSMLLKLLGVKRRIGFNYKNRGRFLTDRIDIEGYTDRHAVEYYLDLLRLVNLVPGKMALSLSVPQGNKISMQIMLERYGIKEGDLIIGIAPGAGGSWGASAYFKQWPAIRFAQLADKLISELNAKVVLLGDASESAITEAVNYSMKNKPVDLCGKTTLEELIAVVSLLKLLITNDGGPLHIAVALGVNTISIFGPVDETVYGPYPQSEMHRVFKKELDCRPCYKKFRVTDCDKERACINSITVDEIFNAVPGLLSIKEVAS